MTRHRWGGMAAGAAFALLGLVLFGSAASADAQVRIQSGDTLWALSARYHVSVGTIARRNHLGNPNLIFAGQRLDIPTAASRRPSRPRRTAPARLSFAQVRRLLDRAARRDGVNPAFIEAVAWWESGWNQNAVSPDGAIGIMQVMPDTGAWVGPGLLGRPVDLHRAQDNVDAGTALLAFYLQEFHGNPKLVLAAYYQGAWSVQHHGILKSSRRYVDGIWALRNAIQAGTYRFR